MNILVAHNYYIQRGGEDSVFENEIKALKDAGHNVIKYSRHNDETKKSGFIKRILFFFEAINSKKTIKDLKDIIKKNKIDIAHFHNTFPLISPSIYRFLRKNHIKIVQTIHNYRFLCPNGLFYTKNKICTLCKDGKYFNCVKNKCYKDSNIFSFLYYLIIKLNRKVFKNSINGFIALTEFTKNIFIESGFKKEKIYIKQNGFYDTQIKRMNSKGYFLFLGRLSQEKGIDFLLESFTKLPDFRLKIAGISDNINQLKEKYKYYQNIDFLGFVSGEQKDLLIAEAIALLVPSIWYENYPISIVEAFRSGIPVIGSNIGGIPYIITDNQNGYIFETNNFDDFRQNITNISNDLSLREKLGDNAREYFIKNMEFSKNIKILLDIYGDVLNVKN